MIRIKKQKGFTLIEILIAIAIIGIIASVVVVMLTSAKDKARISRGKYFSDNIRAAMYAYELGCWNFDETAGMNVANGCGSAVGTVGGAANWQSGIKNNSLYLNGSSYVNLPNFNIADNNSIELWIRINSFTSGICSTLVGNYPYNWHFQIFNYNNEKAIAFRKWGSPFQAVQSNNNLFDTNKWYHVALSLSPNPTNNYGNKNVKIYVNGKMEAEGTVKTPLALGTLMMSYHRQADITYFNGNVDELKIYSKPLTAQQVQQRYAESAPRHGIALK